MTPERRIQRAIMQYLWAVGIYSWVNASTGTYDPVKKTFRVNSDKYKIKGTSDILGILPGGRLLAIEVKTKTGAIRPEQQVFLENIQRRGGVAFVARSVDDVRQRLAETIPRPAASGVSSGVPQKVEIIQTVGGGEAPLPL